MFPSCRWTVFATSLLIKTLLALEYDNFAMLLYVGSVLYRTDYLEDNKVSFGIKSEASRIFELICFVFVQA